MVDLVESGDGDRAQQHVRCPSPQVGRASQLPRADRCDWAMESHPDRRVAVERVGLAFQMVDDVLNLSGFDGDYKTRGEDITAGVTMPVAIAILVLGGASLAVVHTRLGARITHHRRSSPCSKIAAPSPSADARPRSCRIWWQVLTSAA